jgi:hypothetical protein
MLSHPDLLIIVLKILPTILELDKDSPINQIHLKYALILNTYSQLTILFVYKNFQIRTLNPLVCSFHLRVVLKSIQ